MPVAVVTESAPQRLGVLEIECRGELRIEGQERVVAERLLQGEIDVVAAAEPRCRARERRIGLPNACQEGAGGRSAERARDRRVLFLILAVQAERGIEQATHANQVVVRL